MAANPHRGEVEIELEGQTLLMRPTFACLVEIEQMTGTCFMDVITRFAEHRYGIRDVTAVVAAGLRGAGAPVSDERVAEMVFNTGLLTTAMSAAQLLASALRADVDEDDVAGEAEPEDALGESEAAEG